MADGNDPLLIYVGDGVADLLPIQWTDAQGAAHRRQRYVGLSAPIGNPFDGAELAAVVARILDAVLVMARTMQPPARAIQYTVLYNGPRGVMEVSASI